MRTRGKDGKKYRSGAKRDKRLRCGLREEEEEREGGEERARGFYFICLWLIRVFFCVGCRRGVGGWEARGFSDRLISVQITVSGRWSMR